MPTLIGPRCRSVDQPDEGAAARSKVMVWLRSSSPRVVSVREVLTSVLNAHPRPSAKASASSHHFPRDGRGRE